MTQRLWRAWQARHSRFAESVQLVLVVVVVPVFSQAAVTLGYRYALETADVYPAADVIRPRRSPPNQTTSTANPVPAAPRPDDRSGLLNPLMRDDGL